MFSRDVKRGKACLKIEMEKSDSDNLNEKKDHLHKFYGFRKRFKANQSC